MLLCVPLPILIYFVRKKEIEFSTAALGNSRPVCPPSRHPFFLSSPVFYLFIPYFPALSWTLNRFGAPSGIWSSETGFGYSFITAPLFSASPLLLHPGFTLMYFFILHALHLNHLQKAQKGWRESFSSRWRLGLWLEKPCEDLPKAKETLSNN